jgi:hypothetical protein
VKKALGIPEQQIVDGRQAAAMLKAAGGACRACGQDDSLFTRRVRQIVKESTDWFRTAADQNPIISLRYIAALSEAMALYEELQHRVTKAAHAEERLHATAKRTSSTSPDA